MLVPDLDTRLRHTEEFYQLLDRLEASLGGMRTLATAAGRLTWPTWGVYFFFEPGERRTSSGNGLRVVRIGSHALNPGESTTLWGRLRAHRGTLSGASPGGGNHRGSVFRRHVGMALMRRDQWAPAIGGRWGRGNSATKDIRDREIPLERAVSDYIGSMPFLWVGVPDRVHRGNIEGNAVALLSNSLCQSNPIDPPSNEWLGHFAANTGVQLSGLWNDQHTAELYAAEFLSTLEMYIP